MAIKSYVATKDFTSPYVRMTNIPHKPQQICYKKFKKGDVINGELKHANNKPAIILVAGVCPVPLSFVKELITKDVVVSETSSAEGDKKEAKKLDLSTNNPKIKYLDAMIIGGLAGLGAVYLAEKQNWIVSVDKKNKIYGALAGAALGLYLVYRNKNK
jgi:hypothetical protein